MNIAAAIERDRRAALFPELVEALDALVGPLAQVAWYRRTEAENAAIALLVRCRKPKP